MPERYPPEFRRKILDLVASGRRAAELLKEGSAPKDGTRRSR